MYPQRQQPAGKSTNGSFPIPLVRLSNLHGKIPAMPHAHACLEREETIKDRPRPSIVQRGFAASGVSNLNIFFRHCPVFLSPKRKRSQIRSDIRKHP